MERIDGKFTAAGFVYIKFTDAKTMEHFINSHENITEEDVKLGVQYQAILMKIIRRPANNEIWLYEFVIAINGKAVVTRIDKDAIAKGLIYVDCNSVVDLEKYFDLRRIYLLSTSRELVELSEAMTKFISSAQTAAAKLQHAINDKLVYLFDINSEEDEENVDD